MTYPNVNAERYLDACEAAHADYIGLLRMHRAGRFIPSEPIKRLTREEFKYRTGRWIDQTPNHEEFKRGNAKQNENQADEAGDPYRDGSSGCGRQSEC